ncbi:HD superfamily phosphodiesterase [Rhabdobacter roseus]|uniref:HD superfamily phosphodiesterase n=1 Tax=Rhabdobacter roseus TaxID=1655419 RepID=A0A840TN36_9BACT|nr:HD domain-containing protein [Rhabdobacter roseus]MBB5285686.1 HD superfamily phosphodiesterase [Rhabdobacter roseus]
MDFLGAQQYILQQLEQQLPPTLYYHSLGHTQDVVRAALSLAAEEGVRDEESLLLLHTAALYHDAGFMHVYAGHEQEGCRIVREVLPGFRYTTDQIEHICRMILATKIPQTPSDALGRILCDADLDYLGRDDFEPIAGTLFRELLERQLVPDEPAWNRIQVQFLEAHRYWTATANSWRENQKQQHLMVLRQIVQGYDALPNGAA